MLSKLPLWPKWPLTRVDAAVEYDETLPTRLLEEVAAEAVLDIVEVEPFAECGSFLGLGEALLLVLGDLRGTCGGLSSCSSDGIGLLTWITCFGLVLDGIIKGASSFRSIVDDRLRIVSSEDSTADSSTAGFLAFAWGNSDSRGVVSHISSERRGVQSG